MAIAAVALLSGSFAVPDAGAEPFRASDITVSAEPDSLLAGERLHYLIVVRHDSRQPVKVEGLEVGPDKPFELARRSESSAKLPDGSVELRVTAELAAFGAGRQRLPGFTVTAGRDSRYREARLAFHPTASVVVTSLTDSTMTRLRPAASPVGPGFLPWLLLLPAIGVVGLLAFAIMQLLRMTVFRDSRGAFFDPSRAARQKLRSLDRQLSKGLAPAEAYETLSNILREFLQHKFRFRAMEQVTQEIAEELESREVKAREVVLKLLLRADLIKFADGRPDLAECRSTLKIAEAFCSGTPDQLDAIAGADESAQPSSTEGMTR